VVINGDRKEPAKERLSFWDILKTPFMKFAEAQKSEAVLRTLAEDEKSPYQKGDMYKKWFTEFWYVPVVGILLLLFVFRKIR